MITKVQLNTTETLNKKSQHQTRQRMQEREKCEMRQCLQFFFPRSLSLCDRQFFPMYKYDFIDDRIAYTKKNPFKSNKANVEKPYFETCAGMHRISIKYWVKNE